MRPKIARYFQTHTRIVGLYNLKKAYLLMWLYLMGDEHYYPCNIIARGLPGLVKLNYVQVRASQFWNWGLFERRMVAPKRGRPVFAYRLGSNGYVFINKMTPEDKLTVTRAVFASDSRLCNDWFSYAHSRPRSLPDWIYSALFPDKTVEPDPEIVEPEPDVVEPEPEVVEPEPEIVLTELKVSEPLHKTVYWPQDTVGDFTVWHWATGAHPLMNLTGVQLRHELLDRDSFPAESKAQASLYIRAWLQAHPELEDKQVRNFLV